MNGIIILVVYAFIMIAATICLTKKEKNIERFCVGDRNINWLMSSLSIAATWIWAPALFVSTEKAYLNGIVGLFWFLIPNILCLIIFIPFAKMIRKQMPEGITLSGYMMEKYSSKPVKGVYLFQLGALSILSTAVQLLAGSQILALVTDLPFFVVTILLAIIAYSYSQFSGIKASILTDSIQMCFMLVASIAFVIFALKGNGVESLFNGLSGVTGEYSSLLSEKGIELFFAFGLPTTVGLLSGPFGDQSFWQRAFSVKKRHIGKSFFVGALLFGIVPLSMGIVGFIGAGNHYTIKDVSVINFELISKMFPSWVVVPFLFMIISGLLSTVDSNLCSISSLTTDIAKTKTLKWTKGSMILLLLLSIIIANIPNLTVTHLFLIYGTLRASTLFTTVLTLKKIKLSARGVTIGVISSLLFGLPIFAYGTIYNISVFKTAGSLITVLASGLVALLVTKLEEI